MKTLIIYYSQNGSTEIVARTLAKELKTDILEVKDLKQRSGLINKATSCFDAIREKRTKISPSEVDLSQYSSIYIGTPTWAGKPTPAIITLIDKCNLRNKDIILFATMTSRGGQATVDRMTEKVNARGARVIETFTLNTKNKDNETLVNDTETVVEILDLKMYKSR